MRGIGVCLIAATALGTAACGNGTAPEEARYPIVEGLYNVDTQLLTNTCHFGAQDGGRVYVFFQERGGIVQFRPPRFDGTGQVDLLDFGIQGQLEPSGEFLLQGTYTIGGPGNPLIVAFSMEGVFDEDSLHATERHLASFPGGTCEVTFSLEGLEI